MQQLSSHALLLRRFLLPSFLSLSLFLKQFQDRNETISSLLLYSSHGANLISPEGVSITDSGIQALTTTHSLIIHCIT